MAQDQSTDNVPSKLQNISSSQSKFMIGSYTLPSATFSIATPAVTTILPITESMNDTSFMLPVTPHQHDAIIDKSFSHEMDPSITDQDRETGVQTSSISTNEQMKSRDVNEAGLFANNQPNIAQDSHDTKLQKKRNKLNKKSTKLDAKSKLEKSRQSARECRARKKLRYQYLEDLVSNREKAVVKLREELTVFCELSEQVDLGNISEASRLLLSDQIKENNLNDPSIM